MAQHRWGLIEQDEVNIVTSQATEKVCEESRSIRAGICANPVRVNEHRNIDVAGRSVVTSGSGPEKVCEEHLSPLSQVGTN